ncbi:hypothetical protein F0562_032493 [Nyssa sinensis]|uniref:Receptor ligand binding region domain-containing protein n=1 Tax=Nyssa sinensis TaxID=561372 RepID=A0A5J5AP69_9ASTE|nr:hypothetical protein F0562_032493 [Nyssa sinensis]
MLGTEVKYRFFHLQQLPVHHHILMPLQWPFLTQMTSNVTDEIRCIAAIIRSFHGRRLMAIYEVDTYGDDLGMFSLLSEALQNIGSEIEYRLVLPPFSSLSDPEGLVREEVAKLLSKQSRVFIVLQSSLSLATYLSKEAKQMRLMGKDTAWVITETLSGLLDSVNTSVIHSMEGVIAMKAYFSEERQKVHSSYTHVVVVVCLFVVLALSSSYTTSLTSMLTIPKLVLDVTDIEWLKRNNAKVGCGSNSFIRKYMENVLEFKSMNIKNITSEYNYSEEFKSGNITAAFLELPYAKALLNHNCKGYRGTSLKDRFEGLGFVSTHLNSLHFEFLETRHFLWNKIK